MSNTITTYTGRHFEPTAPAPDMICIEDIAHALSLITRGNGHVKTFWSVGQHCLCCAGEAAARGLSDRMVLACLLHDASECYMSDIPRPFKKQLPEYQTLEDRLLGMIYTKFLGASLTGEEQKLLKEIDDAMLWYDLVILLGEKPRTAAPEIHIEPDYTVRPFAEVEEEYLKVFARFSDRLSQADREGKPDRLSQADREGKTDRLRQADRQEEADPPAEAACPALDREETDK